MEVITSALDEIALSGLEGCTPEKLFFNLSTRQPPLSNLTLTHDTKEYIWRQLLLCTKFIRLYQTPHPIPLPEPMSTLEFSDGQKWYEFLPQQTYHVISDGRVRGSCSTYHQRQDITDEVLSLAKEEKTLEKMKDKYGENCMVIVGSQDFREHALFPNHIASSATELSDIQFCLLESLGMCRHNGIFRTNVTNKYLRIDPRSTFHHVRVLRRTELAVVKILFLKRDRSYTPMHTIFLTRFSPSNDCLKQQPFFLSLEERFCSYLETSPNNLQPSSNLMTKMGIHFPIICQSLIQKGYIEETTYNVVTDQLSDVKGFHLVKPYERDQISDMKNIKIDSDEEDTENEMTSTVSIVTELPLDVQGYRIVDDSGPEGITMPQFQQKIRVSQLVSRMISKSLIKNSSVTTVLLDSTPVRTTNLVSQRHLKSNKDFKDIEMEVAKQGTDISGSLPIRTGMTYFENYHGHLKTKKEKKSKTTSNKLSKKHFEESGTSSQTQTQSPSVVHTPPPHPEESIEEMKLEGKQNITPKQSMLTLTQLKRLNLIMEFMEKHRVENGLVNITKHLRLKEVEGGKMIDRKTVIKLVDKLVTTGRLCQRNTVIDSDDLSMNIILYYLPCATEQELIECTKKTKDNIEKAMFRREQRQTKKKSHSKSLPKTKKSRKSDPTLDVLEEDSKVDDEIEDKKDDNIRPIPGLSISSKFMRIKHFHFYLWILAFGFESAEDEIQDEETGHESMFPETLYPWIKAVKKLPSRSSGCGLVSYNDVLFHMPLSLMIILNQSLRGGGIPSNFLNYMLDPALKNQPFHALPLELRKFISHQHRDDICIGRLLTRLEELKFITLSGSILYLKDRSHISIKLIQTLEILDTSNIVPRHTFFLKEARPQFNVVTQNVSSITDLEQYWIKLYHICIATPIIIGDNKKEIDDDYPLVYDKSEKSRRKSYWMEFNRRGFGAGGHPPLFFSHWSRNWLNALPQTQHTEIESDTNNEIETSIETDTYGPGMSLGAIAGVEEEAMDWEDTSENVQLKRKRPSSATDRPPKVAKVGVATKVLGTALPAHSGGKGLKRDRAKKALKIAHRVQRNKAKPKVHVVLTSLTHPKGASIEDETALSMRVGERSIWYSHEDNFIILAYIATLVLHKLGHPPTDETLLRNALHKQFKTSKDKTTDALHRRLTYILKHTKDCKATINTCLTEVLEELNSLGSKGPDQNFDSILNFVLQRYKSHDGHLINVSHKSTTGPLLPATVEELKSDYTCTGEKSYTMDNDIETTLTVKQTIIINIILSALDSSSSSYNAHAVFKLLEKFSESDIKTSLDCLKSKSYVVGKRPLTGVPRVIGPLGNQTFALGTNFYQRFEGWYSSEFFKELKETELQCEEPFKVETETMKGGDVAFLVGNMFNTRDNKRFVCEPHFPNPLLIADETSSNKLIQSALEDEELDDEEEEENTKIGDDDQNKVLLSKSKSQSDPHKLGIGTLFDIDENAHLQYGTVTIKPSVDIGPLLEPLENDENVTSTHETTPTTAVLPTHMTLESFVTICECKLNYSSSSVAAVKQIYDIIDKAGENGVAMATLEREMLGNGPLHDILQDLINFELVYSVGTTTPIFVSHTHSHLWCMDVNEEKFVLHPWANPGSVELNTEMTTRMQHGVLMYIISHPGTTLDFLLHHFKYIVQRTSLEAILQNLTIIGCIKRYTYQTTPVDHSPFRSPASSFIKSYHDDDSPSSICYEATLVAESIWAQHLPQ